MSGEIIAFILYFIAVLGIGIYFFFKIKGGGEKDYFLGGRKMNAAVAALSAGASDMSSWVLMGLPASIIVGGLGQVWIAIGLAIGTILSWLLMARRLRRFSIVANDSITIPQYITNRFLSKGKGVRIISAIIFVVVYTVYSAASIKACGTLFSTVLNVDATKAMYFSAAIIIVYTFLGGFSAVCWTDFIQGILMLIALMITPIAAMLIMNGSDWTYVAPAVAENYWNFLPSGKFDWSSISTILTGLGWGLGYFGMPHIIVRFMAIKSDKAVKKSSKIGIAWTVLILLFATAVALVGRSFLPDLSDDDSSLVFINMVRKIFPGFISGILLSAILAAAMSTADSQLLASASAFSSDVYKPLIRKNASDKEMLWAGRIIVIIISIASVVIAINPNSGSIMSLVESAWGLFGAAFGPVLLLSLFWKRFTYKGAVAGMLAGGVVDALWLIFLSGPTGLYEIIPGFIVGLLVSVIVTLIDKKPSAEVEKLFDDAVAMKD